MKKSDLPRSNRKNFGPPAKFELIDEPESLSFSRTLSLKNGYYREALTELEQRGGALMFEHERALNQIRNAAKRLGFQLKFARSDGKLYVKIDGYTDPPAPKAAAK